MITLIGLACNLLNIAILTSNKGARRIPSWTLLLALAICDCLYLVFATLEVTPLSLHSLAFSPTFNFAYSHVALYIRTLASTFYKSSVLDEYYYVILMSENETLRLYYRIMDYVSLFAFNVLPIIALLVMNCMIIVTLRRAPARLLHDFYGQYHAKAIIYTCISQQLVFLNASLNFALYCVVSKRYRILMRQTIKRLLRSFKAVDLPMKMSGVRHQSKSSTAPATSMEDHHSRQVMLVHAV
ncbi:unnamed protein product [Nippostrongylus brasiliensis]|uniref:G_PROTEIN_RECEP_F1_2 domain-containing protein n=1 Tax=Nippostrongylus brasiliensis TaxID=27835 RepID=A0A0N4Y730_NIPBR|nr:unnamed protein product [Nippostrongylus brasiliensis]